MRRITHLTSGANRPLVKTGWPNNGYFNEIGNRILSDELSCGDAGHYSDAQASERVAPCPPRVWCLSFHRSRR
jgi:hypothetical protein